MLASSNESSKTQIDFYSSRADLSKPLIQVNYREANIDPDSWETDKDAAISPEINVNTTASWTATANQPWIALSSTSGTGLGTFNVSVTENPSANHREGTVTVALSTGNPLTLTVWQGGSTAYFSADKDDITFNYKGSDNPDDQAYWASVYDLTKAVYINTNYDWTVEIIYTGESTGWLSAEKKKDGNLYLTATKTNTTNAVRKATVTIKSGETVLHEIGITQLDEISSYFNQLNPDDPSKLKTSSDYNHPLAAWAMKLSYAAYNYPSGLLLPPIPGLFMGDMSDTATDILHEYGFVDDNPEDDIEENIWEENYVPLVGVAAHTIGHREITIIDNSTAGGNKNDGSDTTTDTTTSNYFDAGISTVENGMGDSYYSISGSSGENTLLTTVNNNNTRHLVVVVVRGSVSFADWIYDFGNQLNAEYLNFQAGMKEVVKSLYGCTELCDGCNGAGCENASAGYLENIDNPIILITGHSLGAAVANLTANYLTQELGEDNVYAYTFATPNTVNEANGEEAIEHDNIFNILNNNDAVPHFPWDLVVNEWARHGQDFHITMPWSHTGLDMLDTDLLGALGHGMPTYYDWMNNLPNTFAKPAEDIIVTDLNAIKEDFAVGFFAKVFEILCPVSVTLYDTDGSIVAYESQQEGAVYPEITDTGIVSWIAEDGGKMFLIPYGTEDIEARIEAYDYGTMTLTVEQPGIGEPIDSITYNNVNLYPEKEFKIEIAEEFDSDNVALMQVETDPDGNEIETEITDLNPLLKGVTLDSTNITYGTTTTITVVTDKSVSKVQFIDRALNTTITCDSSSALVTSIVEDGDNLIWTIQMVFARGTYYYDVAVKVGNTWHRTENVFKIIIN